VRPPQGRTHQKKGAHAKKKGFKKSRDTKRRCARCGTKHRPIAAHRQRDVDQIFDDVARQDAAPGAIAPPKPVEFDEDLPGGGAFYCVETGRHFTDERALEAHKKTRFYKKRVKELREETQYTQAEAEAAAGMTKEVLPTVSLRGGRRERGPRPMDDDGAA